MAASLLWAAAALAGCKKDEKEKGAPDGEGRVSVVVSVNWEGAYLGDEAAGAMKSFREKLPDVPVTHFITPAYYTKPGADEKSVTEGIQARLRPEDEVALHVHAWHSLVSHAQVPPKLSPSFFGSESLMEFEDDVGYEVELAAYEEEDVRKILRSSSELLADAGFDVAPALRVGGNVAVPHVLAAARAEGFEIDSSAADPGESADHEDRRQFSARVREVWPDVGPHTQPFSIETPEGTILEMPAHTADYLTAEELESLLVEAREALEEEPDAHVFVDILFHQETAHHFSGRALEALQAAQKRFPGALVFETKTEAAERARRELDPE